MHRTALMTFESLKLLNTNIATVFGGKDDSAPLQLTLHQKYDDTMLHKIFACNLLTNHKAGMKDGLR